MMTTSTLKIASKLSMNPAKYSKKATGRSLTGINEALIDLLLERGILKGAIISWVKEYFERYSNLETLENYLRGLSGPSAYVFCAGILDRRKFHVKKICLYSLILVHF